MLRQVHLHPDWMRSVTRIAFILPDDEYMVFDPKDQGFDFLVSQAESFARTILEEKAKKAERIREQEEYALYMRLKAKYET